MDLAFDDMTSGGESAGGSCPAPSARAVSLLRTAKLVSGRGEFICVVRDLHDDGVRLRCFHTVPDDTDMALELHDGELIEIERVGGEGCEASFVFRGGAVDPAGMVHESGLFPRRQLRLNLAIPLVLRSLTGSVPGVTSNISQQGCRLETDRPLSISQSVLIDSPHLPGIRAKVRWRRDGECGLVFDDTFTLSSFARLVAKLQCPVLLDD